MKMPDKILKGWKSHFGADNKEGCKGCPYWEDGCIKQLKEDVQELLEEVAEEKQHDNE